MQGRLLVLFSSLTLALLSSSCSSSPLVTPPRQASGQAVPSISALSLSPSQEAKIGQKIWQNESAGKVSGLTAWNQGEGFPSLGIGHFIWYPVGKKGPFTESWPQFYQFARQRGLNPPAWAAGACPWTSRAAFQSDLHGARLTELRKWLARNVPAQAAFIARKSEAALAKVLAKTAPSERARLASNYRKVATTANGTYALIDYVNFKGEGINSSETYRGQGWGLKQVLLEMRDVSAGQNAAREFAAAAKRVLGRRISNSPPARGEKRWQAGWFNRADTYAQAF